MEVPQHPIYLSNRLYNPTNAVKDAAAPPPDPNMNFYHHRRQSSMSDPELSKLADAASDTDSKIYYNPNKLAAPAMPGYYTTEEGEVRYRAVPLHQTQSEGVDSIQGRYAPNTASLMFEDENTYYNPHYMSRTPSTGSSGAPSSIDQPVQPHYYEIQPRGPPELLPLDMVDRELHSRRVSVLHGHGVMGSKKCSAPPPAQPGRRFSMIGSPPTAGMTGLFRKNSADVAQERRDGFTFGKKSAQRLIKRSKLSTITGALGSELSSSASALYALFTGERSGRDQAALAEVERRRHAWNASDERIYARPEAPDSPVAALQEEPRFLAGSHLNDASTLPVHVASTQRKFSSVATDNHYAIGNAITNATSLQHLSPLHGSINNVSGADMSSEPNNISSGNTNNNRSLSASIGSTSLILLPPGSPQSHRRMSAASSSCSTPFGTTADPDQTPREPQPPHLATAAPPDPNGLNGAPSPYAMHTWSADRPTQLLQHQQRVLPHQNSFHSPTASPDPQQPDLKHNNSLPQLNNNAHLPPPHPSSVRSDSSTNSRNDQDLHSAALNAVAAAHSHKSVQPVPVNKMTIALAQQAIEDFTDQAGAVSDHTQRGIDFLEKYGQFVKERAQIEDEYALKLRNLVKKCSSKKKEEEEWKSFTYFTTFHAILRELDSLAAQHETISDKLKKEICPNVLQKCMDLRMGRKRHLQELQALNNSLNAQIENMQKMKKHYIKSFKEAENAHVKYDKAEKNMDLSRAELERTKVNLAQKNHGSHDARCRYFDSLEHANRAQFEHYNHKIPLLLDQMRHLDMDRIAATKQAMNETVDVETGVLKVVQRCYDDMRTAINVIDPEKDTHLVVELKKTGYAHPPDFAFVDLGDPARILENNGESMADAFAANSATLKRTQPPANGKSVARKGSMHHRIFGGSGQNGKGQPQSEYGNLPPQQRCRKLEQKLHELDQEIAKKDQSQLGLQRMHTVYTQNPKMGNAADVERQLAEFQKEMDHLADQKTRYQHLLRDAQAELNQPQNGGASPRIHSQTSLNGSNGFVDKRTSYSEDSISSDGSAVMGMPKRLNGNAPPSILGSSNGSSLNAGVNVHNLSATTTTSTANNSVANHSNIPHIDAASDSASQSNVSARLAPTQEIYESADPDQLPVLGTCKALYPFEGTSGDGTTISMQAGEELQLLEKDEGEGDGWTRVRNKKSGQEGFVPTSYLECRWY